MSSAPRLLRPLAALNIVTTGPAIEYDRVVEIDVVKFTPDGERTRISHRLNPGIPMPSSLPHQEWTECPAFQTIAAPIARMLRGCDLCGYGIQSFALPILLAEFSRAGIPFSLRRRSVIDVARWKHSRESSAQVSFAISAVLLALLARNQGTGERESGRDEILRASVE
jgi:DNA polymerase-3 subunit epsilon